MVSHLSIGLAQPAEYAAVAALLMRAYLPSGLPLTDPYYQDLTAVAGRADMALVLTARMDGTPVGTVTWCAAGSPLQEVAAPDEAEMRMLAVDPSHQGSGVGRALAADCIERSRATGHAALALSTAGWMTRAHRLYESLGFVRTPARDWQPRPDVHLVSYRLVLGGSRSIVHRRESADG